METIIKKLNDIKLDGLTVDGLIKLGGQLSQINKISEKLLTIVKDKLRDIALDVNKLQPGTVKLSKKCHVNILKHQITVDSKQDMKKLEFLLGDKFKYLFQKNITFKLLNGFEDILDDCSDEQIKEIMKVLQITPAKPQVFFK